MLEKLIRSKRRGVFVTVADINREIDRFLFKYQFNQIGVFPDYYRENSFEVFLGRRFARKIIHKKEAPEFFYDWFLKRQGLEYVKNSTTQISDDIETCFFEQKNLINRGAKIKIVVIKTEEALPGFKEHLNDEYEKYVLISDFYSFEKKEKLLEEIKDNNNVNLVDLCDLQKMFYPILLVGKKEETISCFRPLEERYEKIILPDLTQQTLGSPLSTALKWNNVYAGTNMTSQLRRGSRIFFHSMGNGIVGEGIVENIKKFRDMDFAWEYVRTKGAFHSKEDFENYVGDKDNFDLVWLNYLHRYEEPVSIRFLDKIGIPSSSIQGGMPLTSDQIVKIKEKAKDLYEGD